MVVKFREFKIQEEKSRSLASRSQWRSDKLFIYLYGKEGYNLSEFVSRLFWSEFLRRIRDLSLDKLFRFTWRLKQTSCNHFKRVSGKNLSCVCHTGCDSTEAVTQVGQLVTNTASDGYSLLRCNAWHLVVWNKAIKGPFVLILAT